MRKLFAVLALTLVASFASAQTQVGGVTLVPVNATAVSTGYTAVDTVPALIIKYFPGRNQGAVTPTVANVAATSMTFTVAGAAYTGFECPIAGSAPWGGVLDLSQAACSDLGEVVDAINSTKIDFATGYFRAAIVNGQRADISVDLLTDAADTDVGTVIGEIIYQDTSENAYDDIALIDWSVDKLAKKFFTARDIIANPFADTEQVGYNFSSVVTNAGTIGLFTLRGVTRVYGSGKDCVAAATCGPNAGSSEVLRTITAETGAASNARGELNEMLNAGGFKGNKGEFLAARRVSDQASSALASNFAYGLEVSKP